MQPQCRPCCGTRNQRRSNASMLSARTFRYLPMTCNMSRANFASGAGRAPRRRLRSPATTTDPAIPVGKCPVYAVQSPDLQRLYVLNRGDDTISVINTEEQYARHLHAISKSEWALDHLPSHHSASHRFRARLCRIQRCDPPTYRCQLRRRNDQHYRRSPGRIWQRLQHLLTA